MIYTPHTLQVLNQFSSEDENGNPITTNNGYQDVCKCRCDDNGSQKMVGVAGTGVVYSYHVVLDDSIIIPQGTMIKVLDEAGAVRAEGKVIKSGKKNFLPYSEIYI